MAIARFPSIVIDGPDPGALAAFHSALLDWKAEVSPGWADIRAEYEHRRQIPGRPAHRRPGPYGQSRPVC
jgi:hypothetical protein